MGSAPEVRSSLGQASRPDERPGFCFCRTAERLGTMRPHFLCVTEGGSREPEATMPCFYLGAARGTQVNGLTNSIAPYLLLSFAHNRCV